MHEQLYMYALVYTFYIEIISILLQSIVRKNGFIGMMHLPNKIYAGEIRIKIAF